MAVKAPPIKIDREKLMVYLPRILQIGVILFFLIFVLAPLTKKISRVSNDLKEKNDLFIIKQRTYYDLSKLKKDLSGLEKQAAEYDQRLPPVVETNMLIDSFRDITRESRLKFTSIEPMTSVKFELPDTGDFYYELPIRIKLKCSFFELVDFINRIEKNKRLMKISSLQIRANAGTPWDHQVEIVFSNFARANKNKAETNDAKTNY